MKQRNLLTITLLGSALVGTLVGLGATRLMPPAQAAPPKPSVATAATPAAAPLAEAFSGKTYPLTLPAEKIDSNYHLTALVDAQGKASLVATRGETISGGGEAFLVCYDVPLTNSATRPPQPKAGTTGNLLYVNLHVVQAMAGILPITPPDPAADTPAPTTPTATP
jgi:hypothetical protein